MNDYQLELQEELDQENEYEARIELAEYLHDDYLEAEANGK